MTSSNAPHLAAIEAWRALERDAAASREVADRALLVALRAARELSEGRAERAARLLGIPRRTFFRLVARGGKLHDAWTAGGSDGAK